MSEDIFALIDIQSGITKYLKEDVGVGNADLAAHLPTIEHNHTPKNAVFRPISDYIGDPMRILLPALVVLMEKLGWPRLDWEKHSSRWEERVSVAGAVERMLDIACCKALKRSGARFSSAIFADP